MDQSGSSSYDRVKSQNWKDVPDMPLSFVTETYPLLVALVGKHNVSSFISNFNRQLNEQLEGKTEQICIAGAPGHATITPSASRATQQR